MLALDSRLISVIIKIPSKLEEYLLEFPFHGDALTVLHPYRSTGRNTGTLKAWCAG